MADTKHHQEAKEALSVGGDAAGRGEDGGGDGAGGGDGVDGGSALDAVLAHAGEFGRCQKLLFAAMLPFGLFFAFVYFVQMFIAATPQRHWCRVPELQHLDLELRRNLSVPGAAAGGEWARCAVFAANWSEVASALTPPPSGSPTEPCRHGWEFELSDIPYPTVVSERGWVCERAGLVPAAQAVFFAGSVLGGVFFGWMADRFGRVPALVGANLVACAGGVATIYTGGFWDFALCRFLVGAGYDNVFMMFYILVLEYVGPRQRTLVANMSIALFFGGGCVALPWLALWAADWRRLLWLTSLPMLLALAAPRLLPESARWLAARGRPRDALAALAAITRLNRTHIPQHVLDDFLISSRQCTKSPESLWGVVWHARLRSTVAALVFVYMACAVVFDGLVRLSESLGLDFFVTFTLTSATEIPSVTLVALVMDRLGRRALTAGPLAAAAALAGAGVLAPRGVAQTALAIAARFAVNMAFNAVIQWSAELAPTPVRASASSALHITGYVATALSPFIVYSERVWSALPLAVLCAVAALAALAALVPPETRARRMPQSLADAEHLVRAHSLCSRRRSPRALS